MTDIAACSKGSHLPEKLMRQKSGSGGERLENWLQSLARRT